MKKIFYISLIIFLIGIQCLGFSQNEKKDILPIFGVWNPVDSKAGFTNEYTKDGLFKRAYDGLVIKQNDKNKGMVEGEIGIIHDIGDDVRIVGISGHYPKYRIKFKHLVSLLNEKQEYYDAWITGELYINFKNRDEMFFELIEIDLDRNNQRYEDVMRRLKMLIKPGKIYRRAEKLDKPITPDAP